MCGLRRPQPAAALAERRKYSIVVAKLDRLGRERDRSGQRSREEPPRRPLRFGDLGTSSLVVTLLRRSRTRWPRL